MDGNGFFGYRHFQQEEWLRGLASVANHFKGKPQVSKNARDWYNDFIFLKKKALDVNLGCLRGPAAERWNVQPLNLVCAATIESLNENSAFVMSGDKAAPLWLSAFGPDVRGNYYYREGQEDADDTYALLDQDWTNLRDRQFPDKFQLLQRKIQGIIVKGVHQFSHKIVWKSVSLSGLRLATSDKMGEPLCLEMDSSVSKIVTKKYICTQDDDDSACLDNPQSHQFNKYLVHCHLPCYW
ncbi:hypothetical protein L6164_019405 [Bauhinia variegata]|uniref:Uncharacterized protein n=1 Tax=Bauhinia variegata TaxID=167791 RepID=A0ACB9MV59_BAUVA|nr:hypothetical protein L6164_019405 [Bauhinia variegata]